MDIEALTPIFRDVFGDETLVIDESTTAADVEGWDSFTHINLIMSVEEAFGVSFTTKEIGGLACVKELVDKVCEKIKENDNLQIS